jgi:hypothetical protein
MQATLTADSCAHVQVDLRQSQGFLRSLQVTQRANMASLKKKAKSKVRLKGSVGGGSKEALATGV